MCWMVCKMQSLFYEWLGSKDFFLYKKDRTMKDELISQTSQFLGVINKFKKIKESYDDDEGCLL